MRRGTAGSSPDAAGAGQRRRVSPSPGPAPADVEVAAAPQPREQVEVRRSKRRRRTVSAYREDGRTVVLIPARMSRADERYWVETMLGRLTAQESRARPTDAQLQKRAQELSARYLDGRARPASVRWVGNQSARWGSCTPVDATIRLSTRLRGMPRYVVDYVLLHELAHLIVPDHSPAFWALLESYPRTERARGYLDGVCAAAGLDPGEAGSQTCAPDAAESPGEEFGGSPP